MENCIGMDTVASIIVTYNPDTHILSQLLDSIREQVSYIIVIDNSECSTVQQQLTQQLPEDCFLITQGFNSGIAAAFNAGVFKAQELSASHLILFDQDSLPESDMVKCLLAAMNQESKNGHLVAAVGPNYIDIKGQHVSPFVRMEGMHLCRIECSETENVRVDHLISSGSLISMQAIADVGLMEEKLFIDYVDTEWCLRAIYKGYQIFGVGSARMKHNLGNDHACLFGRVIPVHSPLRYYYLIRNGIWLLKQSWVSHAWKIMDLRRLILIFITYSFLVGRRFSNCKMLSMGVLHACLGRMGRYGE